MTDMRYARMFRFMGWSLLAVPSLLARDAQAQGTVATGPVTSKYIFMKDTLGGDRTVFLQITPQLDSLIKRLNSLPVGSAEFFAVDSAIQVTIRSLPWPQDLQAGAGGGQMRISVSAPRAALRTWPMDVIPQGWLGFTALAVNRSWPSPAGNYLQYFEYPTIVAVENNSPASKAGIRVGDSLLAYNGLDVRSQPINMTQLLEPGREVAVRVRREGEFRDYEIRVEKAPPGLAEERRAEVARQMASTPRANIEENLIVERTAAAVRGTMPATAQGRAPTASAGTATLIARAAPSIMPTPSGVLGAAMTDVNADLAGSLVGMKGKRGVLVTTVHEGSPAYRTGLRSGDVILRVGSSDVATTNMLRVLLREAEQDRADRVKLTVLRGGKTREITYAPPR